MCEGGLSALQCRGIAGDGGSPRTEFPGSCEQTPNLLSRIHPRVALPSSSRRSCVDVRSRQSAPEPGAGKAERYPPARQRRPCGHGHRGWGRAARWLKTKDRRGGKRGPRGKKGRLSWVRGPKKGPGVGGGRPRFVHACLCHQALLRRPPGIWPDVL